MPEKLGSASFWRVEWLQAEEHAMALQAHLDSVCRSLDMRTFAALSRAAARAADDAAAALRCLVDAGGLLLAVLPMERAS